MNTLFLGMACILTLASGYWILGRGTPRPDGTWAMGALLGAFGLAFASYAPVFQDVVETAVPHVARLLSNSFSLVAATAVLAVTLQLNLQPDEARRQIRRRLALLTGAVLGMAALFAFEQATHRSPRVYALYVLIYIAYLTFTVSDFLRQTLRQSKSSKRRSVRIGLRMTAAGCVFALIYAAYKVTVLLSLGLGLHLVPDHARCSSLTSSPCVFSVTSPALAVLLIALGLTLPAVVWPISQLLRRRWERRSVDRLGRLWTDLSTAMPEIVLSPTEFDENTNDSDFVLQRRVIEISDGLLALRPYRYTDIKDAAERALASSDQAGTADGTAIVEAAVVKAAIAAQHAGCPATREPAPPAPGTSSRAGDLRAETDWLLRVADAYANNRITRVAAADLPAFTGA